MRFLTVLATAFLPLALTGCAAQKMSQEDRAALRRVSIATVQMPEKATVFGNNAGAGFLFGGPLGTL